MCPVLACLPARSAAFRRRRWSAHPVKAESAAHGLEPFGANAAAHPLWDGIDDGARFYFVHSYFVDPVDRGVSPLRPTTASPLPVRWRGIISSPSNVIPRRARKPDSPCYPTSYAGTPCKQDLLFSIPFFPPLLSFSKMLIIPAIDLKDGQCVRLKQV